MKRATQLAALLLVLVASPVMRGQTLPPPAGFPAVGETARITVTSTGAAPKKALRYTIANGYRGHMNMDMSMGMAMNLGGQAMPPMDLPSMRIGADVAVTGVTTAGDITYTIGFTGMTIPNSSGVDPAVLASMEALNPDFKSVTGTATVTNRGISKEVHIDLSKATNPQFSAMMDSLSTSLNSLSLPFPEEAVGVGAHWEIRQALASGGVTTFQKIDCDLTAVDATTVSIKFKTEQTAPSQSMKNNPNLPPGANVTIENVTGAGTGTMSLPLDGLVPTSESNTRSAMTMSIDMGAGGPQRMTVETTMKLVVAPGKS